MEVRCSRYLFSRLGQAIVLPSVSVRWTLTGRKKPRPFSRGFVFALPIFTASHPATIVGVHVLNFCVRDGNRWTHMTINTNSYGWVLPIFYIKSLAASNSFWIIAPHRYFVNTFLEKVGDPYRIRTDVNGVRGRCLNHLTNGPWCTFRDSNPGPTD